MKKDPKEVAAEVVSAEWERVHSWTDPALERLNEPAVSEIDRRSKERVRENLRVSAPLVEQLRSMNIPLKTLGELGNVRLRYPVAVPLLLEHLDRDYPDDIYATLFAALTPRYGADVFRRLYRFLIEDSEKLSDQSRYTLANAVAENAIKTDITALLSVVKDTRFGHARSVILQKLAKWDDAQISPAILSYLREGKHNWTAIRALRTAKVWSAVDEVRPFLESDNVEMRKEARAFLKAALKESGA